MNKEEITRANLKSNIMKSVMFRLDYNGVVDTNDLLKRFTRQFRDEFKKFESTFHTSLDHQLNKIYEVSDLLSVPVKELEKQEIMRFTENTFGNDTVTFDIGKYTSVMMVNCQAYSNIDAY